MELLVIWLVIAVAGAIVASNKGRSAGLWLILCLLMPILIVIVLILPARRPWIA